MCRIRNYTRSDLEKLRELYVRAGENSLWSPVAGGRQFDLLLERPQYSPEADLFVAESRGGRLAAYADVIREVRIGRVVMDLYVQPRYRRRGVGRRLVEAGSARGSALGAQKVHVLVGEANAGGREFLARCGFEPVRRYLTFELEGGARAGETEEDFGELALGQFHDGDEPQLADIQNRCFEGSWGFCPNTADEIGFYLAMTMTRMQDVMALRDGGEVVGYLWPQIIEGSRGGRGKTHGWIHMVGVRPDRRGGGLGKKLVRAGLRRLSERGAGSVELTVDAENLQATTLYSSLGFVTKDTKIWYERQLP